MVTSFLGVLHVFRDVLAKVVVPPTSDSKQESQKAHFSEFVHFSHLMSLSRGPSLENYYLEHTVAFSTQSLTPKWEFATLYPSTPSAEPQHKPPIPTDPNYQP